LGETYETLARHLRDTCKTLAMHLGDTRSSEGRVLETADAFLDDKADRLWKTWTAALRELAQKVRDGIDLVLLCTGRIESCHGDLLRKVILAEAAQLEATSQRKPRSDKGKPRGPRGPRADSVETAARMGVLATFYLRHAYGRDSPGLHEESGVLSPLSANGGGCCVRGAGKRCPGSGRGTGRGEAMRGRIRGQGDQGGRDLTAEGRKIGVRRRSVDRWNALNELWWASIELRWASQRMKKVSPRPRPVHVSCHSHGGLSSMRRGARPRGGVASA